MNDQELNIIQSPEAEKMRRMVTAGFYDRSELALWIFQVIGTEYDQMAEWSRELAKEAFPQTCTEKTIAFWEFIYQIEPDNHLEFEVRRQKVLAKRMQRPPINPARLEEIVSTLTGCDVRIYEDIAAYKFRVTVTLTDNKKNLDAVVPYLNKIKPAHLAMEISIGANKHKTLKRFFSHEELNKYSHYEINSMKLPKPASHKK